MASTGYSLGLSLFVAALLFGSGARVEALCKVDVAGIVSNCLRYLGPGPKVPPSPECCNVVKSTDIGCACQLLGGSVPVGINFDKVCYVASACHNPLTPGLHCGSYTVPATC